jgi:hypothetical protein
MSDFPSHQDQLKNLTKLIQDAILDVATNQKVFVSDEEQEQRLTICRSCEHFHQEQQRCKQCGCFMQHKTTYRSAECPIGLW